MKTEGLTPLALDEAKQPPASPSATVSLLRALLRSAEARLSPAAVAFVLCRLGVELTAVFHPRGVPEGRAEALAAGVRTAFATFAGPSHRSCLQEPLVVEALEGIARTDVPATAVEAPLVLRGRVAGLLRVDLEAQASAASRAAVYELASTASEALEALERARDEAEGLWAQLGDALPDGVVVLRADGTPLLANDRARRLLNDLAGPASAADVSLEETPLGALVRHVQEEGSPREVEYTLSEAPRVHIWARAEPLPQGGGAVVVLRDVTEQRLLQERLLQSEKMASVGQLVSGVAHELNNPLTGVMGFAQLLLMRDLDERSHREVETIYSEAERAAKIVQNLLSFARRRRAEKELVDVNVLLERVLELRSYDLRVKNIALELALDPHLPKTMADADQLQQVFFNMIINAEQAMLQARGRGRLCVGSGWTGDAIRLTFADDGPGIPPENLRRIFDPFFTTKEAGAGTGLGLTIAYGIIEEHGGRISVESALGRGATFTVDLPITQGAVRPPEETEEEGESLPGPEARGRRILVVDDEENIQTLLRGVLAEDGHRVDAAGNGVEALDRLSSDQYDLVITDIKMPEMSGQEFYRRVREMDRDLARRMVFITGDTINATTRQFLQRVHNPCLAKPFKLREVREVVERQLPPDAG